MTSLRCCLILWSGLLVCGVLHAEGNFLKDHPVVIVEGLPGDIESEKNYEDQTLRLLGLLNRTDLAPSSITLLSSLTNFDYKSRVPLEVLPNQRESFLRVAGKEGSLPPVFIVFGHGGLQGKTQVFHVPGPRLTPEDFVKEAEAFPESTWLLFFPGSGTFAKVLQGEKRSILATESGDKTFKQDPVSFALFLDLLKKESDLLRLGQQLGIATRHWYEDRSLARTEDPALWVGGEAPAKLVDLESADVAGAGADPDGSPTTPKPASPTDSGEAWAGIKPVDPRDYPQANAVVLLRKEAYVLGDNPRLSVDEESYVQILTKDGKEEGDFRFSFSPPDEDLKFLACEVRRPDGSVETLDPDSIRNAEATKEPGEESAPHWKIFSLPHVEPGAILHVRIQRQWKRFPLPEISQDIPLADALPIKDLSIELRLPEKSAFHFKVRNQKIAAPEIRKTAYGSIYSWHLSNVPALLKEPLQASEQAPALLVTTFPDWENFTAWYQRLIREADLPTPALVEEAKALTAGLKTDREKIEAVAKFVTGFRYVSVPLGVNSHRPHAAGNVFQNRYGDCKDKANLLNTMLQSLGYKTSLVLVPRFSQAYEEIPGFAFNHAISQVRLKDETLWIDSTDDICRFGLLPPGDPGRKVLVVDEKITTLTPLPEAVAKDNRLVLESDLTLDAGRTCAVKMEAVAKGYADYQMRYAAQKLGPQPGAMPLLNGSYMNLAGLLELKSQKATAVSEMDSDFNWKGEGSFLGLLSQLPQSPVRFLRLPAWLPDDWNEAMLPRQTPLYLNRGYPMEMVQRFKFHLPAGTSSLKLPDSQSGKSDVFTWKLTWASASPTEVSAELELILLKADLTLEQSNRFQGDCRKLVDALQDGFSFQNL